MAHALSRRGENYFFLSIERPSNPSVTTVINHPAPVHGDSESDDDDFRPLAASPSLGSSEEAVDWREMSRIMEESTWNRGESDGGAISHAKGATVQSAPSVSFASNPVSYMVRSESPLTEMSESDNEGSPTENQSHAGTPAIMNKEHLIFMGVQFIRGISPYHNPRRITLYNNKPSQTWFYDRQRKPISSPPKVPRDGTIPFKALYICDLIDSVGSYVDRQTWINNSHDERKAQWVIATGDNARQTIDGMEYGFYFTSDGPHWVKKKTLTRVAELMSLDIETESTMDPTVKAATAPNPTVKASRITINNIAPGHNHRNRINISFILISLSALIVAKYALFSAICALPVIGYVCSSTSVASDTTSRTFDVCTLPFLGHFCSPMMAFDLNAPRTDFPRLVEIESRTFEQLLDEVADGPTTAMAIKKAQRASMNLVHRIHASCLEPIAKQSFIQLLNEIVEEANETFYALIHFHAQVDAAARNMILDLSYVHWRLKAIAPPRSSQVWFPVLSSPEAVAQSEYLRLLDVTGKVLGRLEGEVALAMSTVTSLEKPLDKVHNLAHVEYQSVRRRRYRETSRWFWTFFGFNREVLQHVAELTELLEDVADAQQRASAHITAAAMILASIKEDLLQLSNDVAAGPITEDIPLEIHLHGVRLRLEKLTRKRMSTEEVVNGGLLDSKP
ncbi:hypothetical protein P691DRAFT_764827 [Macrolepiota fuliginosa MF-IS2]|uniref:Uncharacterized protein n=1 Tax=Macrolepiota fuliginosa MF-IS2 TaxID=1400762 RepID=A0A9P5X3S2_9AGAR|nr:hypothetical protein P691DRAFT_764827 [Macrolepiota fuliginosa MF-IS2]